MLVNNSGPLAICSYCGRKILDYVNGSAYCHYCEDKAVPKHKKTAKKSRVKPQESAEGLEPREEDETRKE